MHLTIRSKLFTWFLIISVIPLLIIGGISYYFISSEISKQTEEKIRNVNNGIKNMVDTQQKLLTLWLDSSAESFTFKLSSLGESRFDYSQMVDLAGHHMPTWYIGNQKITNDYKLVDELLEKENVEATIFMLDNNEFIRVSTSVRKSDGSRIMGTLINSGPVYNKLINGQQFHGRANVAGIWQTTIYQPIRDKSGKLIGAFVLGRREAEYEIVDAIKKITIGNSGYVFIIDSSGTAIIHPNMIGQNLQNYSWIKEIIQNKEGSIKYTFNGESKIVYYTYYEPWDWYIISGGNTNEIFNTSTKLYRIILFTLIPVILISLLIAYCISKSFSKPLMKLMGVMKETQDGDLSTKLDYVYNDEFGILNKTFNNMLSSISILIGKILFNSNNLKEASNRLKRDISQSRDALKGIENGVDRLSTSPNKLSELSLEDTMNLALYDTETLLEMINKLRSEVEEIIISKRYSELNNLKFILNEIESIILTRVDKASENADKDIPDYPISYGDKIENLIIEVDKLNLLLNNISSSGEKLDSIACDLENNINIFKINDSK